jgi:hypothetical protein
VVRILEKALKIICENANLSAQLFLVLCGKVSTLEKGVLSWKTELVVMPKQQGVDRNYSLPYLDILVFVLATERGRSELFPTRTGNFLVL